MKRRNTVSVTPAIGASTVAGVMRTLPMVKECGTTRELAIGSGAKVTELSQNFFTGLF